MSNRISLIESNANKSRTPALPPSFLLTPSPSSSVTYMRSKRLARPQVALAFSLAFDVVLFSLVAEVPILTCVSE